MKQILLQKKNDTIFSHFVFQLEFFVRFSSAPPRTFHSSYCMEPHDAAVAGSVCVRTSDINGIHEGMVATARAKREIQLHTQHTQHTHSNGYPSL